MKNATYVLHILIIATTLLLVSGCGSDTRETDEIFQSAQQANDRENYDKAVSEYTTLLEKIDSEAINITPQELADLHAMRAMSLSSNGDYLAAIKDFDFALKLDPDFTDIYVARAQAYFNLGDKVNQNRDLAIAKARGFDITALLDESKVTTPPKQETASYQTQITGRDPDILTKNEGSFVKREVAGVTLSTTLSSTTAVIAVQTAKVEIMQDEVVEASLINDVKRIRNNSHYLTTNKVISITNTNQSISDHDLGGIVNITRKLSAEQLAVATEFNVGLIYFSPNGPLLEAGTLNRKSSTVSIETTHFSLWKTMVNKLWGTPQTTIDQIMQKEAEKAALAAGSHIEKKILAGLKKNLYVLGLDQQVKSKIFLTIVKNKALIADIASAPGNPGKAAKSTALFIGKVIVDNIPESDLLKFKFGKSLKFVTDKSKLIGEAATELGKGNYLKILELVSKDVAGNMGIAKIVTSATSSIDSVIRIWENKRLNQIYREWSAAPNKDDYWDRAATVDHAAYFRQKVKRGEMGWCTNWHDDGSWSQEVKNCLGDKFKQRLERETIVQKEKQKIVWLYNHWNKDSSQMNTFRNGFKSLLIKNSRGYNTQEQFQFFLQRMTTIQRDLLSLGAIKQQAWNNNILASDAKTLLYTFIEGGEKGYQAKLAQLKHQYAGNILLVDKKENKEDLSDVYILCQSLEKVQKSYDGSSYEETVAYYGCVPFPGTLSDMQYLQENLYDEGWDEISSLCKSHGYSEGDIAIHPADWKLWGQGDPSWGNSAQSQCQGSCENIADPKLYTNRICH